MKGHNALHMAAKSNHVQALKYFLGPTPTAAPNANFTDD